MSRFNKNTAHDHPIANRSTPYIWYHPGWPTLVIDTGALAHDLTVAHLQMGRVLGLLDAIGLTDAQEITRELWVQEAVATAAIEGEQLDLTAVRSSVAHRLGLADAPTHDRVGGQACHFDTGLRGLMHAARLRWSAVAALRAQFATY